MSIYDDMPTMTASLTSASKEKYDEEVMPICDVEFMAGKAYGPLYRVDRFGWKDDKKGNWLGLAKPNSKREADEWYHLVDSENPKECVHTCFITIPRDVQNAVGMFGKVKNGSGFQIKLNRVAIKHVEVKASEPLINGHDRF